MGEYDVLTQQLLQERLNHQEEIKALKKLLDNERNKWDHRETQFGLHKAGLTLECDTLEQAKSDAKLYGGEVVTQERAATEWKVLNFSTEEDQW